VTALPRDAHVFLEIRMAQMVIMVLGRQIAALNFLADAKPPIPKKTEPDPAQGREKQPPNNFTPRKFFC
jgi:hypothetical protein